jgi:hypothetical protein
LKKEKTRGHSIDKKLAGGQKFSKIDRYYEISF